MTAWLSPLVITAMLVLTVGAAAESSLVLETDGGDAWTFEKRVTARVVEEACKQVQFTSPRGSVIAEVKGDQAWSYVQLGPGENLVEARCLTGTGRHGTVRQRWQVRLSDGPKAWTRIVPNESGGMILDAGASELAPVNPASIIAYEWRAQARNPAPLSGLPAASQRIEIKPPKIDGEYYLTLSVRDASGRSDESTAVFRVQHGKVETVDLAEEHPAWVDSAIVYGVVPFFFGKNGFDDITARLDDLASLGVNTLWLSPITAATEGDFGYAVTDFFRVRPEFGTPTDLKELIDAAHARDMRVIMDFVANHVSAENAYFTDAEARKRASPYYTFFARDAAGQPAHYFDWKHLINLNYDNPEVQRWVIEAFAYWLREFNVDGFRIDAIWGPRQRAPEFWTRWRNELKRIKPDVLLLAEASARDPYYFENGFDAAYDWTEALGQWAWREAFDDEAHTASKLRAAIAASLAQSEPDALVFRFLNNNDTGARFLTRYGAARTRVAAAMLLSLPGIPQIYTGEEVGAAFEPYDEGPPIAWVDSHGLRSWYAQLIALRTRYAALQSREIHLLDIAPSDRLLAYIRSPSSAGQNVLVLLNWGAQPISAALPPQAVETLEAQTDLRDLLSGERLPVNGVPVPAYGVRFLRAEEPE